MCEQLKKRYLQQYLNICGLTHCTSNDAVLSELKLSKWDYFWFKQSNQCWNGLFSASSLHTAVSLDKIVAAVTRAPEYFLLCGVILAMSNEVGYALELQP